MVITLEDSKLKKLKKVVPAAKLFAINYGPYKMTFILEGKAKIHVPFRYYRLKYRTAIYLGPA